MPAGVDLALAVEARVRACPGVAGLDPASGLATVGRGHMVRGVRLSTPGGGTRVDAVVDLVGLAGARLHEAADAAREAVAEACAARGLEAGEVEVRVTDVAAAALPPQPTAAPVAASSPPPPPAPVPAPPPAPGPASRTVRVEVQGPDGRPIVLAITVTVEVERP